MEEKSGEDEYTEVDVLEDKEPQDPRAARIESLIKQLLEDTNYHNRRQAAFSLGKLKVEKAVDALHQALEDRSWQVHIAAAWALKKITGEDYQMDYKEWKKRYN